MVTNQGYSHHHIQRPLHSITEMHKIINFPEATMERLANSVGQVLNTTL